MFNFVLEQEIDLVLQTESEKNMFPTKNNRKIEKFTQKLSINLI